MRPMKLVKRCAAACAGLLLAGSLLAGCGSVRGSSANLEYDAHAVCATYGDTEISAAEVSFYVRNMQSMYEQMYGGQTEGLWDMQIRDYVTLADAVKESAVNELYQTYVLADKAEEMGLSLTAEQIAQAHEAADEFMETNAGAMVDAVGAETEDYYEIFERNALAMLAYQSVVENVDTEVSDEEARHCLVKVMRLYDNAEGYNAEETKDAVMALLDGGSTTEEIAEQYAEQELSFTDYTIGSGDYANSFGDEALELQEGEYTAVYSEEDHTWYVVYCAEYMNEEATESGRESVISIRRSDAFSEAYAEWRENAPAITVNEDVLASIDMSVAVAAVSGS